MVERIFESSRFLVFIAIFATAISALLVYLASINIVFHMVKDIFFALPSTTKDGKTLVVELLKILDLLLIGITLQVITVSLYRLFITPVKLKESQFLAAFNIKDFHDLKITLIQVASVVLVILFLEHAVELGGTLETLYLGAAIAIIIAASTFAWRSMK
ncbi:YqhA family protein [Pseudoalteromonas mariniglutinosa]|uniref:YqhA family protein n=1 Tax=Pseudoalteromonas mariniglutinosa TaxID=206042 RepID=UPI00384D2BD2